MFSSKSFVVLALTLSRLICFELMFVYGVRQRYSSFFCMWISIFPSTIFREDTTLSPLDGLGTFVKNQLTIEVYLESQFSYIGLCVCPYAGVSCILQ